MQARNNLSQIAELDGRCKQCPHLTEFTRCVTCPTEIQRNHLITAEQIVMNRKRA